jgi:hypothetical protein
MAVARGQGLSLAPAISSYVICLGRADKGSASVSGFIRSGSNETTDLPVVGKPCSFSRECKTCDGRMCTEPELRPQHGAVACLLDVGNAQLRRDFDHQEHRTASVAGLSSNHDVRQDGVITLCLGKDPTIKGVYDELFVFFSRHDGGVAQEPCQSVCGDCAVAPFDEKGVPVPFVKLPSTAMTAKAPVAQFRRPLWTFTRVN